MDQVEVYVVKTEVGEGAFQGCGDVLVFGLD